MLVTKKAANVIMIPFSVAKNIQHRRLPENIIDYCGNTK